jgi:hypothetical protein
VQDALGEAIDFRFDNVPVTDVLDYLRETAGLNVMLDRPNLEQAGIAVDAPVTIRLKGVPLRSALRLALHQAGLGYYVEDGVLVVTTEAVSRDKVMRRVYPVGNLVGPGKKGANLIEVITKTVEPNSWATEGGAAAITYFAEGQSLVVSQSADVQEQVRQLLEELRAARPGR